MRLNYFLIDWHPWYFYITGIKYISSLFEIYDNKSIWNILFEFNNRDLPCKGCYMASLFRKCDHKSIESILFEFIICDLPYKVSLNIYYSLRFHITCIYI